VKAFNENLPFDQFTIWQLAGDLLPDATVDQNVTTRMTAIAIAQGPGHAFAMASTI
jgi:hypothetical protein